MSFAFEFFDRLLSSIFDNAVVILLILASKALNDLIQLLCAVDFNDQMDPNNAIDFAFHL